MGKVSKVLAKENLKDALYKAIEAIGPLYKFIKKGNRENSKTKYSFYSKFNNYGC